MKEEEFKYLLKLLDGLNNTIFEELFEIRKNAEESKEIKEFSENINTFLKNNLEINPVTTATIIEYFQRKLPPNHVNQTIIQNIYQDLLEVILEKDNVDRFLAFISILKLHDNFVPPFIKILKKCLTKESFRQNRKQVVMGLLPQKRPELLRETADFIQKLETPKIFKLTPEYMLELCYVERTHWLLKAAQIYKQQLLDMKTVSFNINNFTKQILLMVLIDLTNSPETYDLPSLINQLSNIYTILHTYTTVDEQLHYYMIEVKRELTIIKFCLENNCKLMTTSIFSQLLNQSALTVISQLCKLSKIDRYKITCLLSANSETLQQLSNIACEANNRKPEKIMNWDIVTYNSYCAIRKNIDTILTPDNTEEVKQSMDEIKRLVLSIQPYKYTIEVIENLFACLFLRHEYFSYEDYIKDTSQGALSDCSYFYSKKYSKNKSSKTMNAGFICNSFTTQLILNTLKLCLDAVDAKLDTNTHSSVVTRFNHLVKVVNQAIWKLQLVSNLSPDCGVLQMKFCFDYVENEDSSDDDESQESFTKKKHRHKKKYFNQRSTGDHVMASSTISANGDGQASTSSSIDFISVMLAKPNCLVALALYHNDFAKANQIIEMFDLADAEIATEVAFTEQLRNLVSKIKNIILYKDDSKYSSKTLTLSVVSTEVMSLVESFLATNRVPNSLDLVELSSRHQHMQLYSHQNAPFVNAVDILLSSGLNRDITYGLINVVERKLAEVRNSTDVSAVKKTNYVRFIEDVASVIFEIYGNTEKSFSFTDNICDLITDCRIPLKHKDFCKLNSLSKELRKNCEDLAVIVNNEDSKYLDPTALQKYHQIYMNVVAASDKDICNVGDASCYGNKKSRVHYLRLCYIYCKTVASLEQSDDKSSDSGSDTSYFSILEKPLHEIFGSMIKRKELPVTALEPICKKLNVNLIPKLIMNFCPSIPLSNQNKEANESIFNNLLQQIYDFKNTEENLFLDPIANISPITSEPDTQSLTYIVLHNWALAHIIKKIHTSIDETTQQYTDSRTKFINNFMELERFNFIKYLFDGNKYLASLHSTIDLDELFIYLSKLIQAGKILKCLNMIDALTERQLSRSTNLVNLRDLILFKLSIHPAIENNWKYCLHLSCPELKVDLILNNLCHWPLDGAMEVLEYLKFYLNQVVVDEGLFEKCIEWMTKIPLYDQIANIMSSTHWYTIYEKSINAPEDILEALMDTRHFKLCLEWADLHNVSENMKNLILVNLLKQLFEYTNQATPRLVRELLDRLPTTQAVDLVQSEMLKVRNVEILQVCIDYVTEKSSNWKTFENIKIGLQIMTDIDVNLQSVFWDLIDKPLLMIEQFLMNAKLDILSTIINKISPNLKHDPTGDNIYYNMKNIESLIISRNAVDGLLRFYAEKALDMKNRVTIPVKNDDLLQSIDSVALESSLKPFMMPEVVPAKDEWVADQSTDKCMMCRTSIFSMIIRRHHCRRCGRVVCHACSRNRMQVPTYPPEIKFRVCDDCYTQTMKRHNTDAQCNMSDSDTSGLTCMDWCLSINPKRNEAVRNEFSFEFTPNVTLCLTIMKMHSINLDYPRFLLDRSDEISNEISSGDDARLILRVRKSLLLAAAELYSRLPHDKRSDMSGVAETGALHVARCLSHADSMAALVKHCARQWLPKHGAHPSHIIRSLLEAEKWQLALDISTKTGFSRNSVLAAWGKACLRAGCFQQARDKFSHCFKKQMLSTELIDDCEYGKEAAESPFNRRLRVRISDRSNSSSSITEGKPKGDPPLLNEIISLLEELNYPVNQQLLSKAEVIKSTNEKLITTNASKKKITVTEPALNIMHTLASIKKIKSGDYSDFYTCQPQKKGSSRKTIDQKHFKKLDKFFFNECVYYLSTYGSYSANIYFYMKYSDLDYVLKYCKENSVDKELFSDIVFSECLKNDKVNDLFKFMSDFDSSLEMWTDYITHICRTLESTNRLETLYQIQCLSEQHARASATCARLYARPVPRSEHFGTLLARNKHLAAALHHLGSCLPGTSRNRDSKSFHLTLDKSSIDKHTTTISRQIEVAKYLASNEQEKRLTEKMLIDIIPIPSDDMKSRDVRPLTLFGANTDKIRLVAIILVSGTNIEEGFSLAFRVMQENKLDSMSVYTHVAKYLVKSDRFIEVKTMAKCIRASKETAASLMSDQVLETGVNAIVSICESRGQLYDEQAELLIEDIQSVSIKISCYISCRILSTAYILAARHDRISDLRRVLQEAERTNNQQIRNACVKRLTSKTIK